MPPQKKLISQQEFAAKLREKIPGLESYNDSQVVSKILEKRPDLVDKVENPMSGDAAASREQQRLQGISPNALVSPEFWQNHPNMAGLAKGGLDLLPGVGAMAGGALATPETLGLGTIGGSIIGTGAGRGLRDVLAEGLGLENSSPLQKGMNMGGDMALSGIVPATINMARMPADSAKEALRTVSRFSSKGLNFLLKPQIIDDILAEKLPTVDPYQRPPTRGLGFLPEPTPPKTELTAYPPDPNRMPRQEGLFEPQFGGGVQPKIPTEPIEMAPPKDTSTRNLFESPTPTKPNKIKLSAQGNTITNKETGEIVHQSQPTTTTTNSTAIAKPGSQTGAAPTLAGFQNSGNGIVYLQFNRNNVPVTADEVKSMFPGKNIQVSKFSENILSPHLQKFRIDVMDDAGRISSKAAKELEDQIGGNFHDWKQAGREKFGTKPNVNMNEKTVPKELRVNDPPEPPPMEGPRPSDEELRQMFSATPSDPFPQIDRARSLINTLDKVNGIIPKNVSPEMQQIFDEAKPVGPPKLSSQLSSGNKINANPLDRRIRNVSEGEAKAPTSISPRFNPKGQTGKTSLIGKVNRLTSPQDLESGINEALDKIINDLIFPKDK